MGAPCLDGEGLREGWTVRATYRKLPFRAVLPRAGVSSPCENALLHPGRQGWADVPNQRPILQAMVIGTGRFLEVVL